jgi:hypothetical protein
MPHNHPSNNALTNTNLVTNGASTLASIPEIDDLFFRLSRQIFERAPASPALDAAPNEHVPNRHQIRIVLLCKAVQGSARDIFFGYFPLCLIVKKPMIFADPRKVSAGGHRVSPQNAVNNTLAYAGFYGYLVAASAATVSIYNDAFELDRDRLACLS